MAKGGENNFQFIKGAFFESRIQLGGLTTDVKYPINIWHDCAGSNPTDCPQVIGHPDTTGIRPFVYNGNAAGKRYDDFYFSDIVTRINKNFILSQNINLASCPQNTEYRDGRYKIKADAITIDNIIHSSNVENITIDNFQPFIEQVQVFIGTNKVYDMAWVCDENCQGMKPVGGVTEALLPPFGENQSLNISIKTSEPLNKLDLKFKVGGIPITLTEQSLPTQNESRDYTGTIQNGLLIGLQEFSFEFEGEDFPAPNNPANPLLDLSSFFDPDDPDYTACIEIPKRTGNMSGNWDIFNIPTGIDKTHTFTIAGSCIDEGGLIVNATERFKEGACPLFANFTHAPDPSDPCTIRFTDQSIGDIIDYQWEFGDGATSTSASPSHAYTNEGHYPVTLTISDGAEEMVISDIVAVYCGGSPGGGGITPGIISECLIQGPQSIKPGEPFTLSVTAYEGSPPFEFEWIVPSFVTPAYVEGPGPHTFVIDEFFARNGEKYTFNVSAIDREGDDESCQHDVVIRGNIPGVELTIPQNPSTEFIAFATFVEFWNITGHETYRFFIDGIEVTSCYPYSGTCVDVPYPECGPHEFCVVVTDDVGQYEDCTTVWVGEEDCSPPPPPIIPPAITFYYDKEGQQEIENLLLEECGDAVTIYFKGDDRLFQDGFKAYFMEGLASLDGELDFLFSTNFSRNGNEATDEDLMGNNLYSRRISAEFLEEAFRQPGTNLDLFFLFCNRITNDNFLRECYDDNGNLTQFNSSYTYENFITIIASPLAVNSIEVTTSDCISYLEVNASCGNHQENPITAGLFKDELQFYKRYSWKAYDLNDPELEVEGLLMTDLGHDTITSKKIVINTEHEFFQQFEGNSLASFIVEAEVEDFGGIARSHRQIITIPVPIRLEILDTINRCPGLISPMTRAPIVHGGSGNLSFMWSGPHVSDLDDVTSANPTIKALQVGEGIRQYHLRVVDETGCSLETDVFLEVKDLALDIAIEGSNLNTICREQATKIDWLPPQPSLGGSGEYQYNWFVVNEPASSNITILDANTAQPTIINTESTFNLALTVTDLLSGCEVSDTAFIIAQPKVLTAIASDKDYIQVCNGEALILGSPTNDF